MKILAWRRDSITTMSSWYVAKGCSARPTASTPSTRISPSSGRDSGLRTMSRSLTAVVACGAPECASGRRALSVADICDLDRGPAAAERLVQRDGVGEDLLVAR